MSLSNMRSYRRAASQRGELTAEKNNRNARLAEAVARVFGCGFESLEDRRLMSGTPLTAAMTDDGAGSARRVMPQAVEMDLTHQVAGVSAASEQQTARTERQAAKAQKRVDLQAKKEQKVADTQAVREENQAAREEKQAVKEEKKAVKEEKATREEKQALREEKKEEKKSVREEKKAGREEKRAERAEMRAEKKEQKVENKSAKGGAPKSENPARGQKASGDAEAPKVSAPVVEGNTIAGLTVVNARSEKDAGTLTDGATVDLSQVGNRAISIRAASGTDAQSVVFELNSQKFKTDSHGKFTLRGNNGPDYRGWRPELGQHTLKVTPYEKNAGRGEAGEAVTVSFNVVDSEGVSSKGRKNGSKGPVRTPAPPPVPAQPAPETPAPSTPAPANPAPTPTTPAPTPTNPAPTPVPDTGSTPRGLPPTPQAPVVTNGVNNAISVGIENFSGTVTASDVGYFPLKANASGATINTVEFYANGQLIGAADAQPYMIGWANVPQGTYQVTAKAIDNNGGYKMSEAVTFNIVAPAQGQTITVTSGQSIQDAADRANPGDTVLVTAGTYRQSVTITRSGTAEKPITFIFEEGALIDASNETVGFVAEGGAHIVVKGLHVRGANNAKQGQNAAVRTGDYWRLEDVLVEKVKMTGIGVQGSYVTLVRCVSQDNGQNGISSPGGDEVLMIDSKSIHNNTDLHNPASEGGGGKWARTNNVFITGFEAYDNIGPGIWFDINNTNIVITDSVAHHNVKRDEGRDWQGPGFMTEINQGPIRFENNLAYDNDGAGIQICETEDLVVKGNTLINDSIELRNLLRDDGDWKLEDVHIVENALKNGYLDTSSAGVKWSTDSGKKLKLNIDRNTYDNDGGTMFKWAGKSYNSLSEVRDALGFEKAGKTGTVQAKAA